MAPNSPEANTPPASPGSNVAISLEGIAKSFGFRDVLQGIDLEVNEGSCLCVYGQNGAGKSTLARILGTMWAPTRGKGKILGQELGRGNREIRRRSSMVSDQSFLRPELSLEENLVFYGSLYGVRDNKRAPDLLEQFGLYKRRKDQVSTFSQGMVKRANLARSLLHDPDLWILDEPFSGLDQEGQELLKECVQSYPKTGRTVVLVTHLREIGDELATDSIEIVDGFLSTGRTSRHGGLT